MLCVGETTNFWPFLKYIEDIKMFLLNKYVFYFMSAVDNNYILMSNENAPPTKMTISF